MSTYSIMPGAISLATIPTLSPEARKRLSWFDHHHRSKNISQTCRYFGISRKTFHHWAKRYDPRRLGSLEENSRRPKRTRNWEVSRIEEFRILALRRAHIRYGKMKLRKLYEREHGSPISSWKIQRVIQKHSLYYHPSKTLKLRRKRKLNQPKKRITELKKEKREGFLISLDTVVRYWNNQKRYIITAIDTHSKIAFARMYSTKHSKHAADFLHRLYYLLDRKIENIHTDNGSEFALEFREAAKALNLPHYFSRVKTPTDNPFDERFNRTLDEEFIQMGNMTENCVIFNSKLTEWLIEYNFRRPHQSLGYEAPVEFHYQHHKVLPMYPSRTSS